MKPRSPFQLVRKGSRNLAIALISLIAASAAHADSATWTGTTDALWETLTNWSVSPVAVPGTGDTATFDAAAGIGGASISLGAGVTLNTLLFDTALADAYTIGGGAVNAETLTLDDAGAITLGTLVANNELINATVLLGTATAGSYTFTNDSTTHTLTLAGNVQGGSGGTGAAKTLTVTGAGKTLISGAIADGGASSLTLTKSGNGMLTLTGANSYTGATNISVGVLNIQSNTATGTTAGGVMVSSGAALQMQGGITVGAEALTLDGTGVSNDGALRSISGANIYGGAVTLAGTGVRINSDTAAVLLTLNNAAGIVGTGIPLTIGGLGDTSIAGVNTGTAGTLFKDGSGTLTLSAASNFTDGLTLKNGMVVGNVANAFGGATGDGTITLGDSANANNVTLSGALAGTFANPITVASGNTGVATITDTAASIFSGAVTLDSHALSLSPVGSTLTLSGGITGTGNLTLNSGGAGVITLSTAAVNNIGIITNSGITATNVISGGVGSNVTAITENSISSALTISTTALTVNAAGTTLTNSNASGSSLLTVSGGVGGTGDLVLNNNSAIANGITLSTTSVNNSGYITNSGSGSGSVTISAVIGSGVTGVIQNSATSTLNFTTAVNTYTSGLTIKAGTVTGTLANSFGANANVITLGDSTGGSANATLSGAFAGTFANPITVASTNTGVATITDSAASIFSGAVTLDNHALSLSPVGSTLTLSGGITGTGNLTLNAGGAGVITLSTAAVNNIGIITNSGITAANVISAAVGSNVTGITENSISSALTVSGALSVNAGGTTLTNSNASGSAMLTLSGGVSGTGNLVLNNNSAVANGIALSTLAVNNSGIIINSGTGTGTTTISAAVGTNVTGITENSGSSSLAVSGALTVNSGGTTLTNSNASGSATLTLSGGVANTAGNLILNNNSAINNGITVSTAAVNPIGTLTNSGSGSGSVTISAVIGSGVTGVIQNSATSTLNFTTAVNTYTSGLKIKAGTVTGTLANSFGANTNVITLGDSTGGSANATLSGAFAGTFANPITVASTNTGVATITDTAASIFSGAVTLDSHALSLSPVGSALTLSGGITGTGNLTLNSGGAGIITLSTAAVNNIGIITNSGITAANVISGGVGSNVTAITENSTTSALTISATALTVNSGGTTLTDTVGTLTVSGGVGGTGNLILNNNSTLTNGITLSTTAVNPVGTITNSGSGSRPTLISAVIGINVNGVVQNSATSKLSLTGVNTYTANTTITSGVLDVSGAGSLGGGTYAGNIAVASGALLNFSSSAAQTLSGVISGDGGLTKAGGTTNSLILTNANTLAGTVSVMAGRVVANSANGAIGISLKDSGTLANVTGITLGGAGLTLNNTGTADNSNRIVDSAPITLNSGMIDYLGRVSTNSTETLGDSTHAVAVNSGLNYITAVPGASGSAQLTLGSLSRSTGAVLNVAASDSWAGSGSLGSAGNNGRVLVTAALSGNLAAINGVIPGVFSSGGVDWFNFVSYGAQGFAPVTSSGALTGALSTANVTGGGTVTLTGQTVNSFNQGGITFQAANDLLTISSGMTVMSGATAWGTTATRGQITSGTQELFVIKRDGNNNQVNTINSVIVDNANPLSLIVSVLKRDGNTTVSLTAPNTYTGGTFVSSANGGGITLDGTGVTIPYASASSGTNGLVINNGSFVTMNTIQGQIASSNVVTLNGGASLTLVGTNILAGLVFNSNGGTATPTVVPTGSLRITGDISSTPSNVAVTPTIGATGTLDLNGTTAHTITVAALTEGSLVNYVTNGLTISSVIQNGGFTKAGTGVLNLSGTNTYDGDTTLSAGYLKLGIVGAIPSGVGKGNVSIGASGTLDLNALSPTINGLSGAGTVDNLSGVATYTLTAGANDQTSTFSGSIKNSAGNVALTKSGRGTLTLSGTNTYSGATTVSAGTLLISGASALPGTGVVTVQTGGTLALTDGTVRTTTVGGLTLAGPATLGFDWNSSTADLLTTAATATTSGNVGIALNLAGTPTGPVTLIHAAGGLSTANYYLANNTNFTAALTKTATDVTVGSYAAATSLTSAYWYGNKILGTNTAGVDGAMALSKADGTASNWSTDSGSYVATPLVPGATTDVIFSATGATQQAAIVAGAAMSVNSLTFNDTSAVTIGNVAGESITLNSTGTGAGSAISANQNATINTGLILGGSGTFTFTSDSTKLLTVGGPLSGAGALTLAGSGTTVFSGANSYAGDTTISGTLKLAASNVIPDGMGKGNVSLSGTLDMGGFSDTLNGLTGAGIVDNSTGAATYTLSVGGANQSSTFSGTLQNTSGKIALTKVGTGTFTLASTNSYAGDTTVSDGTLKISAANSIPSGTGKGNVAVNGVGILDLNGLSPTINGLTGVGYLDNLNSSATGSYTLSVGANDQTSTFGGSIRNTYGTVGLTKTGTGTLTLSGGNTYTGVTNISTGTLTVTNSSALNGANGSGIALSLGATLEVSVPLDLSRLGTALGGSGVVAGSTLKLNNGVGTGLITVPGTVFGTVLVTANGSATFKPNGMTFGTGSTLSSNLNSNNQFNSALYLAGDATFKSGGITWEFDVPISSSTAGLKTLTFTSTVGAGNSHKIQNANGLTDGAGQLALKVDTGVSTVWIPGTQNYTGPTTITSGIIKTGVMNNGGSDSPIGKASSDASNLILDGGILMFAHANANNEQGNTNRLFTLTGGKTTSALSADAGSNDGFQLTNTGTIVITGTDTSQTLTLTGANVTTDFVNYANYLTPILPDNGAGKTSLIKAGVSTWELRGANTYTGATTLTLGTLQAGVAENAGVSGPFGTSGSIVFNGGTLKFSSANRYDYSGSGRFTTSNNNPYSIDTNSQGVTFATGLAANGSSGLTKAGAGTLTLAAANAFTGTTTVSGGTLAISSLGTLGNGSAALTLSGGALDLGGTTDRTVGTLSITAAATSDYTIKNGSLTGTSYAASLTTGNAIVSASLLGSGITLAKSGAGTLTLAGTNAYTGATTLTAGMLQSVNAGGLSGTASVTVSIAGSVLAVNYGGASDYSQAQIPTLLAKTTFSANTTAFGFDTSNASGPATYGNMLAMAAGLTKLGVGTLVLDQANTYTGTTNVNLGTLVLSGDNSGATGATSVNSGAFLRVGAANNFTAGALTLAGGTLQLRNDADTSFGKAFTLTASSKINVDQATTGNINHTLSMGTLSIGAQTLTATGGNGYSLALGATTLTGAATLNAFATSMAVASVTATNQNLILTGRGTSNTIGPITTGTGTLTLGYSGTPADLVGADAIWALTGTSTYSGTTTINSGKLIVSGTKSGAGVVTVNRSAALGGTGSIAGTVTLANGTNNGNSYIAGGAISLTDGQVGTLTLGSTLTFSSNNAVQPNYIQMDLGSGANLDKIAVTGTHSAATANTVLVFLNQLSGGNITPGNYNLIQGGSAGNTFTGYKLGTTAAGGNVYSSLVASGNNLQVTVAAGTTGPANDNAIWKGDTAVWNTAQWYSDSTATTTATIPGYQSNIRFASTTTPANLSNTLGQDFEINSLTVDAGTAATTISGANMLTIDAKAINNSTLGNGITVNNAAGTTIGTNNATATRIGLGSSQTWTVGAGANLTVYAEITDFGNGYTLTKDGPGTLTLQRQMTYSGGTVVNNGTLNLLLPGIGDHGPGIRGSLTINSGGTVISPATLGYEANGGTAGAQLSTININGGILDRTTTGNSTTRGITFNMTGGTMMHSGGGYWQMSQGGEGGGANSFNILPSANSSVISGRIAFDTYNTQFNVADGDAAVDLEISGHTGGGQGLIKNGEGLLALTANNSTPDASVGLGHSGTTTINAGTLQLGNGGTTGNLNPASAIVDNATLAFNRTNTLTQGTDFNSVISGAGGILQAGTGTTILNGSNTYTGPTTVSNGILSIRTQAALLGGTDALTPAKISVASGAALVVGVGTAPTNFDVGAIVTVLNGTHLGASTATTGLKTGAQFGMDTTAASGGTFTYGNVLANLSGGNDLNFIKTGTGTLVLDQANTYTGTTTVNQGTLKLAQGGSLATTTAVSVANGATFGVSQTSGGTLNGGASLALASGAILDLGDTQYNTLAFSGAATLSGAGLYFDIGTSAAQNDMLTFVGAATTSGTNLFSFNTPGGSAALGTYTLISAPAGGLSLGNFGLSSPTLGSYSLSLTSDTNNIYLNVQDVNNSKLWVGATAPTGSLETTSVSQAFGRVLQNSSPSANITLSSDGSHASVTNASVVAGGDATTTTGTGTISTRSPINVGLITSSTGAKTGTITIDNLAATTAGTSLGNDNGNATINVSGTVVADRSSNLSVALGDIGRQLTGAPASLTGQTLGFTSTGANDLFTDVIIGVTTYNGTNTTGTLAGQAASIASVASSGTATISVTPTNAESFSYTPATLTSASYTATVVASRTVTAPTTTALGTYHAGATVNITSNAFGYSYGSGGTGAHADTEDTTVQAASLVADANGIVLSGGSNSVSDATGFTRSFTGTAAVSSAGGSISSVVNPEFSAATTVSAPYSIGVYSGDMVWSAASGSNWGTNSNWSDAVSGGAQVAPGLEGGFTGVDSATFGAAGNPAVTVDAAASLNALSFTGGTYTLSGSGILTLAQGGAKPTPTINVTSGTQIINSPLTLADNLAVDVSGTKLTLGGTVTGTSKTLTKSGGGILELAGTNNYGDTSVTAGSLLVNGASTGNVTVTGGTTSVGGTGTITGALNVTGILAPGGSIVESLAATGALTLNGGSTFAYQATNTTTADLMVVGGGLSLTSVTLDLTGANLTAGTWALNNRLTLLSYTGTAVTGGFNSYIDDTSYLFGGNSWTINYDDSTKGTNSPLEATGDKFVTLKLTAVADYYTWATARGLTGAAGSSTDPAPDADPDKDGASNLAEYAFNGIPTNPTSKGQVYSWQYDSSGDGKKELILTTAVRVNTQTFTTTGGPATAPMVDGITYTIEGSTTNLASASFTAGVTPVTVPTTGLPAITDAVNYKYVSFKLDGSNGLLGKGFMRAKAVK